MKVEMNPKRVANLLKIIVNIQCNDGFLWYPKVGEMPSLLDINEGIRVENQDTPLALLSHRKARSKE